MLIRRHAVPFQRMITGSDADRAELIGPIAAARTPSPARCELATIKAPLAPTAHWLRAEVPRYRLARLRPGWPGCERGATRYRSNAKSAFRGRLL
jgi:hypothetical protein